MSITSIKAFFEDIVWLIINYKYLEHLANVAHSKIVKVLVPIDTFFMIEQAKEDMNVILIFFK